jgi:hypothetical protein
MAEDDRSLAVILSSLLDGRQDFEDQVFFEILGELPAVAEADEHLLVFTGRLR